MEFKDLLIFQSVSKHKSISGAAKSLNYVQSYVTTRIKSLEAELNTQLFLRHNKGTTLTSDGRKLEGYVQKIMATVNDIANEFGGNSQFTGQLNIGTVETITKLPSVLSMFRATFPNVALSIDTNVTAQIVSKVVDKEMDCAFVAGFDKHSAINKIELFQEKLVLISAESTMDITELQNMPMLVFKKGCNYRKNLHLWLDNINIKEPKIVEFGTLETIIGSVKSGLGISLVPKSTVANDIEKGELYCYELPELYSHISTDLIWHKQVSPNSKVIDFKQIVEQYIATI